MSDSHKKYLPIIAKHVDRMGYTFGKAEASLGRTGEREAMGRRQAASRREQAEQAFDALPADERRRLMDAQRPDLAGVPIAVPTPDSRLRAWAIDVMAKQQAKEIK